MEKNRFIKTALSLVLAFVMTFAPIFSSYAMIASAFTGEGQATEEQEQAVTEEAATAEAPVPAEAAPTEETVPAEGTAEQTQPAENAAPAETSEEAAATEAPAQAEPEAVTQTPAEEAAPAEEEATPEEEAAEEESTKDVYTWKDGKVKVTAKLSDPSIIPDDAELVVKAISKDTDDYNYDAYMDALNKDSESKYDENNTLLYDVAFIKDGVELQPESGKVAVTFEFLDKQLADSIGAKKAADVNVIHLPLTDEIKDKYDTTADATDIKADDVKVEAVTAEDNDLRVSVKNEKVIFETENFSVFAYTVDFEYNGYKFSMPGEGEIELSKVFKQLNIDKKVADVKDVEFSNPKLVEVTKNLIGSDWTLKSKKAFSTEETLTVKMTSGETIVISVKDAQTYTVDLAFKSEDGAPKSFKTSKKVLVLASFQHEGNIYYAYNENDYDLNDKSAKSFTFTTFKNTKANPNSVEYAGQPVTVKLYYADDQNDLFDPNNVVVKPKAKEIADGDTFEGFTFAFDSSVSNKTTITGTSPEYTVKFEFKDVNGNPENPSGITGNYKLYTSITGPNDKGKTITWYTFEDAGLTSAEVIKKYSSFHFNNGDPSDKPYTAGDEVTVVFGKDLEADQNTGSLSNKGTVIGDGDVLGDYAVSVNKTEKSTTYTFQKVPPYTYSITTSDNNDAVMDNAYSGNWYLLSTLVKGSNGVHYYSVSKIADSNTISTADNQSIAKFYTSDNLSNISINNPSSTSTSVYQSGDKVTNVLVYTGNTTANNYNDVIEGGSNVHEVFKNGDVVNKYSLSSTDSEGVGIISFTKIPDLKLKTQFVDKDDNPINENLPDDYYLLIKMVKSGRTYYALEKVKGNKTGDPIKFYEFKNNTIDSTPHYYVGDGETVSTQVVTTPGNLDADLINHKRGVFYNENTIGEKQFRDLTKDLYSSKSEISKDGDDNILTTTFKAQPNNGVEHKITVDFYSTVTRDVTDANKLNELKDPALSTKQNAYYLIIELQNNGKTVGYLKKDVTAEDIKKANSNGSFDVTIGADEEFTLVDDDKVIIKDGKLKFDPTVYNSKVTLYHNLTDTSPASLVDAEKNGLRDVTGYDFGYNKNWNSEGYSNLAKKDENGNFTLTETKLGLFSAYKKIYQIQVEFEGEAPASIDGNYKFRVTADHATSGAERYTGDINDNALNGIVIENQPENNRYWSEYKSDNTSNWSSTPNTNRISGSETFTIEVGEMSGSNFAPLSSGYPVVIGGESYTVSYDFHDMETVHNVVVSDNITTITDKIILKKAEYDPAVLSQNRIGEASEFGIIAGKYGYDTSHTETNFAVYDVKLPEVSIEGSGDGDVPFYAENAHVDKFSCTSADLYFYTTPGQQVPTTIESGRTQPDGSTKIGNVSIIEKDADTIHNYVKSLIDLGKSVSDSLKEAKNGVIRPSAGTTAIDLTSFPDNITIYVDCTDLGQVPQNFNIRKRPGQTVVFNIPKSGSLTIDKYSVEIVNNDGTVDTISSTDQVPKNEDPEKNLKLDNNLLQKIVFNAYNATEISVQDSAGLFLAPNAININEKNSAGWLIAGEQTYVRNEGEMHFYFHQRKFSGKFALEVTKNYTGAEWGNSDKFSFKLTPVGKMNGEELVVDTSIPMPSGTGDTLTIGKPASGTSNTGKFGAIDYTEAGIYVYEIKEVEPTNKIPGVTYDTSKYRAIVTVTKDQDSGKFKASAVYTKDEDKADTAEFTNTYTQDKANLKVKKSFAGDAALTDAEKALITFTVTGPDGKTYTNTYDKFKSNVWDLGKVPTGIYTVKEENAGKTGYALVTTYKVNDKDSEKAEATLQKNDDVTIEMINTYTQIKGSLIIKKNVKVNGAAPTDTSVDGTYKFTVTDSDNKVVARPEIVISKGVSSQVTVSDLVPGTYKVSEVAPTNGTRLIGSNEINITVVPKGTGEVQTAEFTNNTANTSLELSGTKKLVNGDISKYSFSFNLYDKDAYERYQNSIIADLIPALEDTIKPDPIATATIPKGSVAGDDGKVPFTFSTPLEYTLSQLGDSNEKTFSYIAVEEVEGADDKGYKDGIQYDIEPKTVNVKVTYDAQAGTMNAAVDPESFELAFVNEKKITELRLNKTIESYIAGDDEEEVEKTNASLIFNIKWTDPDTGETVTKSAGVQYSADSDKSQTVTVHEVPLGVGDITVEEVYSSNYDPEQKTIKATLVTKDEEGNDLKEPYYTVSFKNNRVRTVTGGGVINKVKKQDNKYVIEQRIDSTGNNSNPSAQSAQGSGEQGTDEKE